MSTAEIIKILQECKNNGNWIFVCGNGGSASESGHMVGEFVTNGIRAYDLTSKDIITAIANDISYEKIFVHELWALAKEGDVLIGLTTSGKSKNVLRAYDAAKQIRMKIIDWPRKGKDTAQIQEYQLRLMHKVYKKLI